MQILEMVVFYRHRLQTLAMKALFRLSYPGTCRLCCRCMRGDDAKKICPDIELVKTPWADGHALLNWYRHAGTEVRSSFFRLQYFLLSVDARHFSKCGCLCQE
jgi:hypothetical protein